MDFADALNGIAGGFPEFAPGHVWLVGAGPGDPGLLTLHAVDAIRKADVVVHDALIDPRILDFARGKIESAGKRGGKPSPHQEDISERVIELARAGNRVLRLKVGDPFVFARGGEEAMALVAAGVPFRIVAGVTAGLAGMVAASIPTTLRGTNQAVILATGHGGVGPGGLDWPALGATGHPLILYMAMQHLDAIAAALIDGGLDAATPAAVIMWATMPEQRVLISTLRNLATEAKAKAFGPPAIIAIGEVVAEAGALRAAARALEATA